MFGLKAFQARKERLHNKMEQYHLIPKPGQVESIRQKTNEFLVRAGLAWEASSPHENSRAEAATEFDELPHELRAARINADILRSAAHYAQKKNIPFSDHWMNFSRMPQAVDILEKVVAEHEQEMAARAPVEATASAQSSSTHFRDMISNRPQTSPTLP